MNIITNGIYAVKARLGDQAGGRITLSTRKTPTDIVITIADNGTGMNELTQKKLFEPFYTTKPVGEGTGLGLSIAYNTIKKHNGVLSVKSTLGEGTEFIITIPIKQ